jgi:hypothetical protein
MYGLGGATAQCVKQPSKDRRKTPRSDKIVPRPLILPAKHPIRVINSDSIHRPLSALSLSLSLSLFSLSPNRIHPITVLSTSSSQQYELTHMFTHLLSNAVGTSLAPSCTHYFAIT